MQKLKKPISVFLSLLLVISIIPFTATGAYQTVYKEEVMIGESALYSSKVLDDGKNRQQLFSVEYQPNQNIKPIVAYGNKIYGTSTINYVSNFLKENGHTPIAGINADYFSLQTGLPLGVVINNKRVVSSDVSRQGVGFYEDGSAIIGIPYIRTTMTVTASQAPEKVGRQTNIEHINKLRQPYSLYLLTSDFSVNTKNTTQGKDVVLRILGENKTLWLNRAMEFEVVEVDIRNGPIATSDDYFVLTCDATGPMDRIEHLEIGDRVSITASAEDARWNDVVYATGGLERLIENGAVQSLSTVIHPRSAVGIKADGSVVLLEVDGRRSGYSTGMGLSELANELKAMGCVEAINLDGGGSSAFAIQYPGTSDFTVVSKPSDGSLRSCANYIFFINTAPKSADPARLFLYPLDSRVLAGSRFSFEVKATDANYHKTSVPGSLSYSVTNDIGTVLEDGKTIEFAQDAKQGEVLVSGAGASGTKQIDIVSSVEYISVYKAGQTATLSRLDIGPGEEVSLTAKAFLKTVEIPSSVHAYTFKVTGDIGEMTAQGIFKAANAMGLRGTIEVTGGGKTVTIPVTVGGDNRPPVLIDNFEDEIKWAASDAAAAFSRVIARDAVYRGASAMKVSYDFTNTSGEEKQIVLTPQSTPALNNADYLNLYVYGDNSKNALYAMVALENGSYERLALTSSIDFTGYKLLKCALPSGAKVLSGISIVKSDDGAQSGVLYFDQLAASYGELKTASPKVTLERPDGQLAFTGKAEDAMGYPLPQSFVSATLNGKKVNLTSYNDETGTFTYTPVIDETEAGIFRLTVEASDQAGNLGRGSADFKVGSLSSDIFSDMDGHWSLEYVDFMYAQNLLIGVKEGDKTYYQPERNITRAEFSVVVAKYLELDPDKYSSVKLNFVDNSQIAPWAEGYVKAMVGEGLINGRALEGGKVEFAPSANLTRAEAATILSKLIKKGYVPSSRTFTDEGDLPSWAKEPIKILTGISVISGYPEGTMLPGNPVRRAEIAKMIYTLY